MYTYRRGSAGVIVGAAVFATWCMLVVCTVSEETRWRAACVWVGGEGATGVAGAHSCAETVTTMPNAILKPVSAPDCPKQPCGGDADGACTPVSVPFISMRALRGRTTSFVILVICRVRTRCLHVRTHTMAGGSCMRTCRRGSAGDVWLSSHGTRCW
eukprot:5477534-Prymnesium_polylepis.1